MADVDYHYSVADDFDSCDTPALDSLALEISTSAIVTALATDDQGNPRLSVVGDACTIWFKDTLSSGDETILDGIVADHDGVPLEYPDVAHVMLEPSGDPNKKLQIVSYEFEANLNGMTYKLIQFSEAREIQGAYIEVINHTTGPSGDTFRLAVVVPPSTEVRTLACAHNVTGDLAVPPSGKVEVVAEGTATLPTSLGIGIKYISVATEGDKPLVNILFRTWIL